MALSDQKTKTQGIEEYYSGKRIFVTGATGLVGRVLVEKILRDLPQIEHLFILIRPRIHGDKIVSPQERLTQEMFASPVFDRLRVLHGEGFGRFIQDKVTVVPGDLSRELLGLDPETYQKLQHKTDVIINSAAAVSFDAPLDVALQLNAMGPRRVMEFAQHCQSATVAHISTCYVNGTREGPIEETTINLQTLTGTKRRGQAVSFNIKAEIEAIEHLLGQIQRRGTNPLRQAGFTIKAWIQSRFKHNSSTDGIKPNKIRFHREWVEKKMVSEGMRWARGWGCNDTYTITKAMGEELALLHRGDVPTLILRPSIIESALESPMPGWLDGMRMLDPLIIAYGRHLLPDFPGNADAILDIVPVDMVVNGLIAAIPTIKATDDVTVCHIASGMGNPISLQDFADLVRDYYWKQYPQVVQKRPKAFPRMTFPTTGQFSRHLSVRYRLPLNILLGLAILGSLTPWGRRLRGLYRGKRSAVEKLTYYSRIYGPHAESRCQYLSHQTQRIWDSMTMEEQQKFNFDVRSIDWPDYIMNTHIPGLRRYVLGIVPKRTEEPSTFRSEQVEESLAASHSVEMHTHAARHSISLPNTKELDQWLHGSQLYYPARLVVRWSLEKFLRFYTGLHYEGLEFLPKSGPFIVVSNHSSHLDTGALMVALSHCGTVHPLAAKDYFFRNRLWKWAFHSFVDAAPFDRHYHTSESLGLALGLLERNHSLVYFPEGGRTPDGNMHPFKRGVGLLALESGAPVIPTYIRGSFQALPKGHTFPKRHPIHVRFGPPINMGQYISGPKDEGHLELSRKVTEDIESAVKLLAEI